MTLDSCPVTLDELKRAQRFPPESLDSELTSCLLAAAEYCSEWMGRGSDFRIDRDTEERWTVDTCPAPVKRAVIMLAGRLFKCPNDAVNNQRSLMSYFLSKYRLDYE